MRKRSERKSSCKNQNNQKGLRGGILVIKLKRTDTTLDLSQKAKLESRLVLILFSLGGGLAVELTELKKKRIDVGARTSFKGMPRR